jgi:hypothetical protein
MKKAEPTMGFAFAWLGDLRTANPPTADKVPFWLTSFDYLQNPRPYPRGPLAAGGC